MSQKHLIYLSLIALVGSAGAQAQPTSTSESPSGENAGAQGSPGGVQHRRALEEVTVTAQKREESLQDAAIPITALTGNSLADQQITDLSGIRAPAFTFNEILGGGRVYIRGIGHESRSPGAEARVAVHSDGVYIARPPASLASFYDVNRVEILRGPQGTLYGRNATAGAVNIITTNPGTEFEGYLSGTVGNYNLIRTEGGVTLPVTDRLSTRVSFQTIDRGGYGENIQTGHDIDDQDSYAGRVKVNFEATDNLNILLAADYFKGDDRAGGLHYVRPGNPPIEPVAFQYGFDTASDIRDTAGYGPVREIEAHGFSGQLDWDLGAVQLTSLTAYRESDNTNLLSNDASTSGFSEAAIIETGEQFSQELRLTADIGKLQLLGGVYYFEEDVEATLRVGINGILFGIPSTDELDSNQVLEAFWAEGALETEAKAVFGQASYELTPELTLTAGARYGEEEKSIDQFLQFDFSRPFSLDHDPIPMATAEASTTEYSFDPKVSLEFRPNEGLLLYAMFSEGSKSGGFNVSAIQTPFDAEELTSYELGLKADLFEYNLRLNISAFHYDYTNMQVSVVRNTALVTENAGEARLQGFELELFSAPTERLSINGSISYLDGEYTDYTTVDPARPELGVQDLSGNRLPYNPHVLLNADISYAIPLNNGDFLTLRGAADYGSKVYFEAFNKEEISEDSHLVVDAFVDYEFSDMGLTTSLFIKNIADETYFTSALLGPQWAGYPMTASLNAPRTYGLELRKRF